MLRYLIKWSSAGQQVELKNKPEANKLVADGYIYRCKICQGLHDIETLIYHPAMLGEASFTVEDILKVQLGLEGKRKQ